MLTDQQRVDIADGIRPQARANCLIKLWTLATAGRQSVEDFMEHLEGKAAEEFGLPPLTKPDKKTERNAVFAYRLQVLPVGRAGPPARGAMARSVHRIDSIHSLRLAVCLL